MVPTVWILEDTTEDVQAAVNIVQKVFCKMRVRIVLWKGFLDDRQKLKGVEEATPSKADPCQFDRHPVDAPAQFPADFIILDLRLGNAGDGVRLVNLVPGVAPKRQLRPFIALWTKNAGVEPVPEFIAKYGTDRVVRIKFKGHAELQDCLQLFLERYLAEGVSHPLE